MSTQYGGYSSAEAQKLALQQAIAQSQAQYPSFFAQQGPVQQPSVNELGTLNNLINQQEIQQPSVIPSVNQVELKKSELNIAQAEQGRKYLIELIDKTRIEIDNEKGQMIQRGLKTEGEFISNSSRYATLKKTEASALSELKNLSIVIQDNKTIVKRAYDPVTEIQEASMGIRPGSPMDDNNIDYRITQLPAETPVIRATRLGKQNTLLNPNAFTKNKEPSDIFGGILGPDGIISQIAFGLQNMTSPAQTLGTNTEDVSKTVFRNTPALTGLVPTTFGGSPEQDTTIVGYDITVTNPRTNKDTIHSFQTLEEATAFQLKQGGYTTVKTVDSNGKEKTRTFQTMEKANQFIERITPKQKPIKMTAASDSFIDQFGADLYNTMRYADLEDSGEVQKTAPRRGIMGVLQDTYLKEKDILPDYKNIYDTNPNSKSQSDVSEFARSFYNILIYITDPDSVKLTAVDQGIDALVESAKYNMPAASLALGGDTGKPLHETVPKIQDYITQDPGRFDKEVAAEIAMGYGFGLAVKTVGRGIGKGVQYARKTKAVDELFDIFKNVDIPNISVDTVKISDPVPVYKVGKGVIEDVIPNTKPIVIKPDIKINDVIPTPKPNIKIEPVKGYDNLYSIEPQGAKAGDKLVYAEYTGGAKKQNDFVKYAANLNKNIDTSVKANPMDNYQIITVSFDDVVSRTPKQINVLGSLTTKEASTLGVKPFNKDIYQTSNDLVKQVEIPGSPNPVKELTTETKNIITKMDQNVLASEYRVQTWDIRELMSSPREAGRYLFGQSGDLPLSISKKSSVSPSRVIDEVGDVSKAYSESIVKPTKDVLFISTKGYNTVGTKIGGFDSTINDISKLKKKPSVFSGFVDRRTGKDITFREGTWDNIINPIKQNKTVKRIFKKNKTVTGMDGQEYILKDKKISDSYVDDLSKLGDSTFESSERVDRFAGRKTTPFYTGKNAPYENVLPESKLNSGQILETLKDKITKSTTKIYSPLTNKPITKSTSKTITKNISDTSTLGTGAAIKFFNTQTPLAYTTPSPTLSVIKEKVRRQTDTNNQNIFTYGTTPQTNIKQNTDFNIMKTITQNPFVKQTNKFEFDDMLKIGVTPKLGRIQTPSLKDLEEQGFGFVPKLNIDVKQRQDTTTKLITGAITKTTQRTDIIPKLTTEIIPRTKPRIVPMTVPWVPYLPPGIKKRPKEKKEKIDSENTMWQIAISDPLSITYQMAGLKKSDAHAYWNVASDKSQLGVGYVKYKNTPPKNPFKKGQQIIGDVYTSPKPRLPPRKNNKRSKNRSIKLGF